LFTRDNFSQLDKICHLVTGNGHIKQHSSSNWEILSQNKGFLLDTVCHALYTSGLFSTSVAGPEVPAGNASRRSDALPDRVWACRSLNEIQPRAAYFYNHILSRQIEERITR
ncbi:hypothetical protein, partial [Desulfolithobacter sp.]